MRPMEPSLIRHQVMVTNLLISLKQILSRK
jgi:hypothetical protein